MFIIYTLIGGFALLAAQILHHEWKREGEWFNANLGHADKVFPKFTGQYMPDRIVAQRKLIYNSNR